MTRIGQRRIPEVMQGGGFGGQSYLLRDEFSDDRAAGAVNGTPAVPGPGNRVDADAGNTISISSGALQIAAAAAFAATHRYDISIARIVGRLMVWEANNSGTAILVGLSNSSTLSDANSKYAMQVNAATNLFFRESGGSSVSHLATVSGSTKYAIALRATGAWAYALISGLWRLVYVSGVNSQTPLWPYAGQISTTGVAVIPYMRVPQAPYISPLWYDSFTRADGALGSSESVGPDSQITPVTAWVNQEGTFGITGNAAQATALAGGIANATLLTTYADAHIRATLTRVAGNIGIVARYQDSSNYLRAYHDGTNAVCQQVVAGVATTLRTGAAAFGAGVIYLLVRGTTGWLFHNGVAIGASFTVPASTYANHGVHTTDLGNTVTAIEMWPDGGNGEHGRLGTM